MSGGLRVGVLASGVGRNLQAILDRVHAPGVAEVCLAIAEGVITRNPAYVPPGTMLLFVPRECPKAKRLVMTVEQAKEAFASLELRERLIVKLAVRVIEFSLDPVKKCLASACEMYVSRAF